MSTASLMQDSAEVVRRLERRIAQLEARENSGDSGGGTAIWGQIYEYLASPNGDPIDTIIQSSGYVVFIYFSSHNANSYKAASNSYTVPTGRKLVVLEWRCSRTIASDFTFRKTRLRDTAGGYDVISEANFNDFYATFFWEGDGATASKFTEVAAGGEVRLEIWNADSTKRAAGAIVICRDDTA